MKVKYIGSSSGNFTNGESYEVLIADEDGDYILKDNFYNEVNEYKSMFEIIKAEFEQLSDWIIIDDNCATRVMIGRDPSIISNRIAFIEKTPRVRIPSYKYGVEIDGGEGGTKGVKADAWLSGSKGSDYGFDINSRKWCDEMLRLLGWE